MTKSQWLLLVFLAIGLGLPVPTTRAEAEKKEAVPTIRPATKEQLDLLETFQKRLKGAGQVTGPVRRKTIVGLLGQEKIASGEMLLSKGRIRLDLKAEETGERQLLVVGDKSFWAVSYPAKELKGAAVQVVTGSVKSKKAGGQGFLVLLGKDGFLKSFTVSGVVLEKTGELRYYLQPKSDWVEAKRALLALSPESKPKASDLGQRELKEIQIWDFQDNETKFSFEKLKFGKKTAGESNFTFETPKNADVMSVN